MSSENILLTCLVLACLGVAAANLLYWFGNQNERFIYTPTSGVSRVVNWIWMAAQISALVLCFAGLIETIVALMIAITWNIAVQFYSIRHRWSLRKHEPIIPDSGT
jgi:hypothetical protein